jgi:hypothetical protein
MTKALAKKEAQPLQQVAPADENRPRGLPESVCAWRVDPADEDRPLQMPWIDRVFDGLEQKIVGHMDEYAEKQEARRRDDVKTVEAAERRANERAAHNWRLYTETHDKLMRSMDETAEARASNAGEPVPAIHPKVPGLLLVALVAFALLILINA